MGPKKYTQAPQNRGDNGLARDYAGENTLTMPANRAITDDKMPAYAAKFAGILSITRLEP